MAFGFFALNMEDKPEDFETVRRLLALKRHETPPPGYFRDFSSRVVARIEREEAAKPRPWWTRLGEFATWRPAILGANALIVAGLGLLAVTGIYVRNSKAGTAANNRREPFAPPATAGVSLDPWTPASPLAPHVAYDRPLRTEGVRYQLQFVPLDPVQISNQFPASIIGPPSLPVMRVSWNDLR